MECGRIFSKNGHIYLMNFPFHSKSLFNTAVSFLIKEKFGGANSGCQISFGFYLKDYQSWKIFLLHVMTKVVNEITVRPKTLLSN